MLLRLGAYGTIEIQCVIEGRARLLKSSQCGFLLGRDTTKLMLMGPCSRSWVVAVWEKLSGMKKGN